eukprot:CAMPEP_0118632292 /NCGR_PEP_ID=MMETSP0785-20121206/366_1 /TAXON_ID=91992 /ORGANISM="Bolidomonas pacifica, Strain CCMP 1866" /LENGTH=252 /DNA_ID=CAMNT_0006523051 /DNA_START=128 /DNA_END=886 /DNA_ORIENTATION=+
MEDCWGGCGGGAFFDGGGLGGFCFAAGGFEGEERGFEGEDELLLKLSPSFFSSTTGKGENLDFSSFLGGVIGRGRTPTQLFRLSLMSFMTVPFSTSFLASSPPGFSSCARPLGRTESGLLLRSVLTSQFLSRKAGEGVGGLENGAEGDGRSGVNVENTLEAEIRLDSRRGGVGGVGEMGADAVRDGAVEDSWDFFFFAIVDIFELPSTVLLILIPSLVFFLSPFPLLSRMLLSLALLTMPLTPRCPFSSIVS